MHPLPPPLSPYDSVPIRALNGLAHLDIFRFENVSWGIVKRYRSIQWQDKYSQQRGLHTLWWVYPSCFANVKTHCGGGGGSGSGEGLRNNDGSPVLRHIQRQPAMATAWTITRGRAAIDLPCHSIAQTHSSLMWPETDYYLISIWANNNMGRLIEWIHNTV